MSDWFQERYHAYPIAVNGTFNFASGAGGAIAGFLCVASGTLTATKASGVVLINALPVTAGVYYPMPFILGNLGFVTLSGGAAGALSVS